MTDKTNAYRMALAGVRILDLTTWVHGGSGVALVADLGADVIKIEDPVNGDPIRTRMPGAPQEVARGVNTMLEMANRNKRSMTLNLKDPKGLKILYRLTQAADVVAENFRPGVAARLGITHPILAKYNPSIVLASANGLGSQGPDAQVGLFDILGHARSGLMDLLSDHNQPEPIRYIGGHTIADQAGAIVFGFGILAGLTSRSVQGSGQHIEVSQLSALMCLQAWPINKSLVTGEAPREPARNKVGNPLTNIYRCSDGKWIALACGQLSRFWHDFCDVTGLEELELSPKYATAASIQEHCSEIIEVIDRTFATKPRSEWLPLLKGRGLFVTPVQDYLDLPNDPQVIENGYLVSVDHQVAGRLTEVASPVKFGKAKRRIPASAPEFGQHTEEILLDFGYSWKDIEQFRSDKTI